MEGFVRSLIEYDHCSDHSCFFHGCSGSVKFEAKNCEDLNLCGNCRLYTDLINSGKHMELVCILLRDIYEILESVKHS